MNKITIKQKEYALNGETIEVGNKLEFKGIDGTGAKFQSSKLKGAKVISIFPDINTGICDAQTIKVSQLSNAFPEIQFISVTVDSPEIIKNWCAGNGVENSRIVSDGKYLDFAKKTKTLIVELKLLSRGFIILDEKNKVTHVLLNDELNETPDFAKLDEILESGV
ncbi:MAG: redoxin family protein [Mycoplasmataceae bacterium]|nr:redoxin family protein [Mycoplasmataceae bacterium]